MGGRGGAEPVSGDLPPDGVGGGGVTEVVEGERAAAGVAEQAQDPAVLHLLLHLQRSHGRDFNAVLLVVYPPPPTLTRVTCS